MLDLEGKLTWMIGSSRSGGSWLLRMLGEHPQIATIDETGIGHHLGVWRPISLAWATAEPAPPPLTIYREVRRSSPDYLFSDAYRDGWEPLLRRFLLERLALQWPGGASQALVVKEPGASTIADWLMTLLPESRLLFLLRDGRDVVESWLDAYRSGGWVTEDGGYVLAPEGRLPFIRWQAAVWNHRTERSFAAFDATPPHRRLLVRYEKLLSNPAEQLERIHALLGVDVAPERARRVAEAHAYDRVPERRRGPGKHIGCATTGRWRRLLTDAEQAVMHEVLGGSLTRAGYAE